jgi:hypothetical protein
MKRLLIMGALFNLFGFLVLSPVYAEEQSVNVKLKQLRGELRRARLPVKDVNSVAGVLRSLLNENSTKEDLRSIVLAIYEKGISGRDLNTALASVNELVVAGVETNEAGSIVLGGIDRGLADGFKGGDVALMNRVRQAVRKKKAQLLEEEKKKAEKERAERLIADIQ